MKNLRIKNHLPVIFILSVCLTLSTAVFADIQKKFLWAVESNNLSDVNKFLAKGVDPNIRNMRSYTPLMIAAQEKNEKLAQLLINADADLNVRNKYGETAIMLASYHGLIGMVQQLHHKGAQINHDGWNPLLYAATNGHQDVIKWLLNSGAEVNAVTDNGTTSIMMAARGNHIDAVNLLLEHGADPKISNENGENALHWAQKHNHKKLAKLLGRYTAPHE